MAEFLKRHVWIVFLGHQLLIFALAVGFLTSVRRITGRTIHAGRDPLTGNIWLASGVHAGANLATFSLSGLWHAGAVISVVGRPSYPNWVTVVVMLIGFSLVFVLLGRYKRSSE